jgi:hypothetical protein
VTYECAPRPSCPACGVEWNDEMVALFEMALGLGCSCCHPFADDLPDLVCHKCHKVLYSPRGTPPATSEQGDGGLDMSPRE